MNSVQTIGPFRGEELVSFLPHRKPMLQLTELLRADIYGNQDQIVGAPDKEGTQLWGYRKLELSDASFEGHFPGRPVYPGVLLLEAMAQTCAFSIYLPWKKVRNHDNQLGFYLIGADDIRYREVLGPGDSILISCLLEKSRSRLWRFQARARKLGESEVVLMGSFSNSSDSTISPEQLRILEQAPICAEATLLANCVLLEK